MPVGIATVRQAYVTLFRKRSLGQVHRLAVEMETAASHNNASSTVESSRIRASAKRSGKNPKLARAIAVRSQIHVPVTPLSSKFLKGEVGIPLAPKPVPQLTA